MFDISPASSTPAPLHNVNPGEAEAFILTLAQALHAYGSSADRLEAMLTLVARRLGIEAQFYSTPTAVLVSFGSVTTARTCLVRVRPGAMDLSKLSRLHETAVRVIHGKLDLEDGRARVAAIVSAPPRYGAVSTILSSGLSSATAALFFGGSERDIIASFAVGLGVGGIVRASDKVSIGFSIAEPVAAAFAAVAAAAAAGALGSISTLAVTLAGIITLLPGLGITTAITELATKNLASGSARFAGALLQLLGLGFGVALGARLNALLPPFAQQPSATIWPLSVLSAGVVVAALSFAVLLRARVRDMGFIVLAGGVAFGGARLGAHLLGPELGAFVGALALGLGSNAFALALDRPAAVVQVPGLLLLVPGSIGLRGVFSLLDNDVVSGVNAAFKTLLVAIALVSGVLFANVALPPRRAL